MTGEIDGVNFAPESVQEEVLQNVRTILATVAGTVPLDREFGVEDRIVDAPFQVAQARIQQEVIAKVRRYEPRAQIESVGTDGNGLDGRLIPTVRMRINAS